MKKVLKSMATVKKRKWKNKDGRIAFAWRINCFDKEGNRIRKGGFKTKADAENALAKIVNQINTGVYIQENKQITFKEASEIYMDLHVGIYCKESTKTGYEGYLNNHIIPYFGKQRLIDISCQQIQSFIKTKLDEKLSNQTINHMLILMSCVFNKMIDDEIILKNPVRKVKKLKLIKQEMKILSMEEVYRVLEVSNNYYPDFYPTLFTALFTGIRQGELIALTWDKINWVTSKMYINVSYRQGILSTPKTLNSIRYVSIPQELLKVLKEWRIRCPHSDKNLVFPNQEGNYQDVNNLVKRKFHKILNNAKIDVIRWHDLRHTFASILINLNQSPRYIQLQMGHASCDITMNRYSHLMPETSQNAVNAIDSLFMVDAKKEVLNRQLSII